MNNSNYRIIRSQERTFYKYDDEITIEKELCYINITKLMPSSLYLRLLSNETPGLDLRQFPIEVAGFYIPLERLSVYGIKEPIINKIRERIKSIKDENKSFEISIPKDAIEVNMNGRPIYICKWYSKTIFIDKKTNYFCPQDDIIINEANKIEPSKIMFEELKGNGYWYHPLVVAASKVNLNTIIQRGFEEQSYKRLYLNNRTFEGKLDSYSFKITRIDDDHSCVITDYEGFKDISSNKEITCKLMNINPLLAEDFILFRIESRKQTIENINPIQEQKKIFIDKKQDELETKIHALNFLSQSLRLRILKSRASYIPWEIVPQSILKLYGETNNENKIIEAVELEGIVIKSIIVFKEYKHTRLNYTTMKPFLDKCRDPKFKNANKRIIKRHVIMNDKLLLKEIAELGIILEDYDE